MITLIESVVKFDRLTFKWCMSRKNVANLAAISSPVSSLGDGYLYLFGGVLLWWLNTVTSTAMLKAALLAFAMELPVYLLFKNFIKRNRPADVIGNFEAFLIPSDRFSFPSGHTAAAFLMATLTACYYPSLMLPVFCLATLIGLSRVLLGVHFPTDILAGIVLGMGAALVAIGVLEAQ